MMKFPRNGEVARFNAVNQSLPKQSKLTVNRDREVKCRYAFYLIRQSFDGFGGARLALGNVFEQRLEQIPWIQVVARIENRHLLQTDHNVVRFVFVGRFLASNQIAPIVDGFFVSMHALFDDVGSCDIASRENGTPFGAQKFQCFRASFQHIFVVVRLHDVAHFIQKCLQI